MMGNWIASFFRGVWSSDVGGYYDWELITVICARKKVKLHLTIPNGLFYMQELAGYKDP
jgi:hypothetical protein